MDRRPLVIVVGTLALGYACTADFSRFDLSGGETGKDASTDAKAGGGKGGSGGTDGGGTGGIITGGNGGTNGGTGGSGATGGGPGGSGGSGGETDGSLGGNAGAGATGGCTSSQKDCSGTCVSITDPTFGCAAPADCTPCAFINGLSTCSAGACALSGCNAGWGNCDGNEANGCEQTTATVLEHCGACNRACSTTNVTSVECSTGVCTSFCVLGKGNCTKPTAGADNGCETDTNASTANCGSCGNNCAAQGAAGGFTCQNMKCGCSSKAQCGGGQNDCNAASRVCVCNGATCLQGESCSPTCKCNGGAKCLTGEVCCQTPNGCRDLLTAADSCGACGRACPPGFVCAGGVCECDASADCDAGSAGTCALGICTCGATACAKGQRCLPSGSCG